MDNKSLDIIADRIELIAARLEDVSEAVVTLEMISERLGVIANAMLQLADNHGSEVAGPF